MQFKNCHHIPVNQISLNPIPKKIIQTASYVLKLQMNWKNENYPCILAFDRIEYSVYKDYTSTI
jgi:hypothetical protein